MADLDYRAMCAELLAWTERTSSHYYKQPDVLNRARALLDQPVTQSLPDNYIDPEHSGQDREVLEIFYTACQSEGGTADEIHLRGIRAVLNARAALAHWGRPTPQPPADGDVEYALEEVKCVIHELCDAEKWITAERLERAGELLQRFVSPACYVISPSPEALASLKAAGPGRIEALPAARPLLAQPVAVSEGLPGDAPSWWYEPDEDDDEGYGGKWTLLRFGHANYTCTHWLPANALPTPETNV